MTAIPHPLHSAEVPRGAPPRLLRREPPAHVFRGLRIEVEAQLLLHLPLLPRAVEEGGEAAAQLPKGAHADPGFQRRMEFTAEDERSQPARSAPSCRRPAAVSS